MVFKKLTLKEEISITNIMSLHYFEFAKDFVFAGEKHDFWEFLYVDKGELEVMCNTEGFNLKQGDIIFHKPNEFHSVWANKKIGPNLIVVSFECHSKAMKQFENKIFSLGDSERNILSVIVKQALLTFLPPLDDPHMHILQKRKDAPIGSEQLIKIHLELLLLHIMKKPDMLEYESRLSSVARERSEDDILLRMTELLHQNLDQNLTLDAICKHVNMSRTNVSTLFKKKKGGSIMKYYKDLKIERAKELIRQEAYNLTEISKILNYGSIHIFSRHFKKTTDMYPSEYAKSVKSRLS
ncbi:helix-turn-helix domain-containing protein [Paenibacillus eucommiae]|uniref:AraC-like DNA-binding protein/quercetin dioxygenase-like cupin family protein n=1 Tax=Paenibacillus eucommiae TaxID=1355755 RepID=A0ABS4IZD8_9BACL|nr:AraC family transcriptional regulator [Paenibacillus eucommiae]MBP1992341.1 AraC-like DNA-binding protein/quercetin dioxygenase-like cupin family protein [Paenibacillus eucommiae]